MFRQPLTILVTITACAVAMLYCDTASAQLLKCRRAHNVCCAPQPQCCSQPQCSPQPQYCQQPACAPSVNTYGYSAPYTMNRTARCPSTDPNGTVYNPSTACCCRGYNGNNLYYRVKGKKHPNCNCNQTCLGVNGC